MLSRLKSLFSKPPTLPTLHLQLYRLQSLPSRSLQPIQHYIFTHFRTISLPSLTSQISQLMTKLQSQTSLRNIITYLLLFKDLICIGSSLIAQEFLNYKLKFQDNLVLAKFYAYVMKIAYTHEMYIETLQIYNNNKGMFSKIDIRKGYKTLNYLMEILFIIETIEQEQRKYLKQANSQTDIKSISPFIIYNRIKICLIADLILYFNYIKHAILTAPLRAQQSKIQQISLIEEFAKISLQFKKVLYESNIENSYFSIAEQKSIVNTKREIQKGIVREREVGILTVRDANRDANMTYTEESKWKGGKERGEFSFGQFTCREV